MRQPYAVAPRTVRGFTLIELLVAIAILAMVAVLSWRGLDQIVRARDAVMLSMKNERALAQFFDQLHTDMRQAALDSEAGQPAVDFDAHQVQIVRYLDLPGHAPRLQIVRYQLAGARLQRAASPPLATLSALRRALAADASAEGWRTVAFMGGVAAIQARAWIPKLGWIAEMAEMVKIWRKTDRRKTNPDGLERSVTGLEIRVHLTHMQRPLTRILLAGE